MQKLMTAVSLAALVASLVSVSVARSATKRLDRDLNSVAVTVAHTDRLIDLVENLQTNEMKLASGWKRLDEELGTAQRDIRNLNRVFEENAKELIRISSNLERDGDKMYTNIVMFGVSVFDVKNDMADLAVRIQDLERVAVGNKSPAPGVSAPGARMEEWNPLKARAGKPASDAAPE